MEDLIMRGYYKDNLVWVKFSDSNRAFYEKSYYGNLFDKTGRRLYHHLIEETNGEKSKELDETNTEQFKRNAETIEDEQTAKFKEMGQSVKRKITDDKISLQFEFKTPVIKKKIKNQVEFGTPVGSENETQMESNQKIEQPGDNQEVESFSGKKYTIPECISIDEDEIDVKFIAFHPMEALYLIERKKLKVFTESLQELDFNDILQLNIKLDPKFWQKYIVYRDIRFRGYIIRVGYGGAADFRVFSRGAKFSKNAAKYVYFIVREGIPVPLSKLQAIVNQTSSDRKELILAIFDSLGDSTFYQLESVKFKEIRKFEEIWGKEVELELEIEDLDS